MMLGPSSLCRENGGAIQALSGPPLKSPDGTRVPSEKKTEGTREEDDSTAAVVPAIIIFCSTQIRRLPYLLEKDLRIQVNAHLRRLFSCRETERERERR